MAEPTEDAPAEPRPVVRRELLLGGALVAVAGGATFAFDRLTASPSPLPPAPLPPPGKPPTKRNDAGFFRRLGRTGLEVTAVGIGAGAPVGLGPLRRAIESGINYVDTSVCYGDSERLIGEVLRQKPKLRDGLVLATKWDATAKMPRDRILASLDKSLSRLGVKQVEIMQIHNLGGHEPGEDAKARLDNGELYAAMEAAKKSGKVKFFGATSHDADRHGILAHAIDKGVFDMLLVKMNVLDFEGARIPELLALAGKHDVGVVAMKSQVGRSKLPKAMLGEKWDIYQANLRWALAQPSVACVVESQIASFASAQDRAIAAARAPLGARESKLLERYAQAISPGYCRGCGATCGDACPDGVDVGWVLHSGMYATAYGWPERGRRRYLQLAPEARFSARCATCLACSEACPHGVDAAGRVRRAFHLLG